MSIAGIIGIFFGAIAGYFGDKGLRISFVRIVLNCLALFLGVFWAFVSRGYIIQEQGLLSGAMLISIFILIIVFVVANMLTGILEKHQRAGRYFAFPADIIIMRIIEVVNAIPVLLLILALVALMQKPSIWYVMAVIGLVRWTGIARFIRAEMLRIRQLNYIDAARVTGLTENADTVSSCYS